MAYEITAARFANSERTAIVITTSDQGDVAISERDRKDLWDKLQASGIPIAAYIEPVRDRRDITGELDELKAALIRKGVLLPTDIPTRALRDGTG